MAHILINYSEHPDFKTGETYSVADFDTKIGQIDLRYHKKHDEYTKHFGDYERWDAEIEKLRQGQPDTDPLTNESLEFVFPYNKVSFSLIAPELNLGDEMVLTERYDIGDGYGGLAGFFKSVELDPVIRNLIEKEMVKADLVEDVTVSDKTPGQGVDKKTVTEIVQESRREVADRIIEMLKEGKLAWRCGWDKGMFTPHNPFSKSTNQGYRGGNRLRLMVAQELNGYQDPRWMTMKQANENGAHVKAGEHGVLVEKVIFGETKEIEDPNEQDPEKRVKKEFVKYDKPIVKYYRVFNAEQIEGLPEYTPVKPLATDRVYDKLIHDIRRSSECAIEEKAQAEAFYDRNADTITLPMMDSFNSKQEFLATMLHEMSHSTGHESRLNRLRFTQFGTPAYAKEELRAELGSVFMQDDLGIHFTDEMTKNHAAYIQNWIELLKNDPNELFYACSDAEKISYRLMKNYENTLELMNENEQPLRGSLSRVLIEEIVAVYQETVHSMEESLDTHKFEEVPKDSPLSFKDLMIKGDSFSKKEKDIYQDLIHVSGGPLMRDLELAALCYAVGKTLGWQSVGVKNPEIAPSRSVISITEPAMEM